MFLVFSLSLSLSLLSQSLYSTIVPFTSHSRSFIAFYAFLSLYVSVLARTPAFSFFKPLSFVIMFPLLICCSERYWWCLAGSIRLFFSRSEPRGFAIVEHRVVSLMKIRGDSWWLVCEVRWNFKVVYWTVKVSSVFCDCDCAVIWCIKIW